MKDRRKRIRPLQILNAVLRGDIDEAKRIHTHVGKKPIKLIFTMDRTDADKYSLLSNAPEHAQFKGKLFTKDEAELLAEDYSGLILVERVFTSDKEIDTDELQSMVEDEIITVGNNGFEQRIINTANTTRKGDKVKINVNLIR